MTYAGRISALAGFGLLALTGCIESAPPQDYPLVTGPKTRDADLFARVFLDQVQERSFAANREFCGVFGRDTDGYVVATQPIRGELDTCYPPNGPRGFGVFATYHTHGGYDVDAMSEVPSPGDLVADYEEGVVGYISTPGGRVWRSEGGKAHILCGAGCVTSDPDYDPRAEPPVGSSYTVPQLYDRIARLP